MISVKPDLLVRVSAAAEAAATAGSAGADRSPRVGADVVEVARVERILSRWNTSFTRRCFTPEEITYCEAKHRPAQHYAGRLAAKEAVYKALGCDVTEPFRPRSIEIGAGRTGSPSIQLSGDLAVRFPRASVSVSISHDGEYAVAVAIA